jgi:hypothetical protein
VISEDPSRNELLVLRPDGTSVVLPMGVDVNGHKFAVDTDGKRWVLGADGRWVSPSGSPSAATGAASPAGPNAANNSPVQALYIVRDISSYEAKSKEPFILDAIKAHTKYTGTQLEFDMNSTDSVSNFNSQALSFFGPFEAKGYINK